jgi:S1-C subfamily serine protease
MLSSLSVSPSFRLSIAGLMSALIFQPLLRAEDVSPATPPSAATASPTPAVPAPAGDPVETSVVKIFSTVRAPDLARPWTKQSPHEISGTGIVIEGKRILTNAHVVLYASQVQVQANQSGEKLSAIVEAVAPGIDLAVLRLEDETFFSAHPPLARTNLISQTKDPVLVYGYPTGGSSLSITKGIVSRIEFAGYKYPVSGLRFQIDAAINPGNSGGPAIVGDRVIGLAFSHLNNAQNIGYIIPSEEIDLFLKDIADGKYDGKPALYDEFQTLENPALRAFLKLDKSIHGIVVQEPYLADADYPLKSWDIITKVGETPVDDEGMIKIGDTLRLRFLYAVQKEVKNGTVPLTIWRAGKELAVNVPVSSDRPKLISNLEGSYPSYFIYGPIVFSPATEDLVSAISGNPRNGPIVTAVLSQRGSPLFTRRGDRPAFDGEELVIIPSPFFPHKLSKGYSNPAGRVIKTVNGVVIKNLLHLVQLLRDSKDEFTVIEFAGQGGESIVLPHQECLKAMDDLLNDSGIRSQGSPDTLAVWTAKPAGQASTSH